MPSVEDRGVQTLHVRATNSPHRPKPKGGFDLGCMADIIAKSCAGGKTAVANNPAETFLRRRDRGGDWRLGAREVGSGRVVTGSLIVMAPATNSAVTLDRNPVLAWVAQLFSRNISDMEVLGCPARL